MSTPSGPAWDDGGLITGVAWVRRALPVETDRLHQVDIRPYQACRAGHLPGALSIDLFALGQRSSDPKSIDAFIVECRQPIVRTGARLGERVIFHEDFSGPFAATGVWVLDLPGHGGGAMLDGDCSARVDAGGPIETEPVEPMGPTSLSRPTAPSWRPPRTCRGRPRPVRERFCRSTHDRRRRSPGECSPGRSTWTGATTWTRMIGPATRRYRGPDTGRRVCQTTLPGRSPPTATAVCGRRSANTYVVLRALGYPRVANDAPSWAGWGGAPTLPSPAWTAADWVIVTPGVGEVRSLVHVPGTCPTSALGDGRIPPAVTTK